MPKCVILNCRNATENNNTQSRITFHNFPNDGLRKEIWTKIIQKTLLDDSWKPSEASVLCSDHFKREDFYISNKGIQTLKVEALPSNNMVCTPGSSKRKVAVQKSCVQTTSKPANVKSSVEPSKILQLKSDLSRLTYFCTKYCKIVKSMYVKHDRHLTQIENYESSLNKLKNNPISRDLLYELVSNGVLSAKDLLNIKKSALQKKNKKP